MKAAYKNNCVNDGMCKSGQFFRNLDFFGSLTGFHIRGNQKFQTNFGSGLTISFIVLVFWIFYYYTRRVYNREDLENLKVNYGEQGTGYRANYDWNSNDYNAIFLPKNSKTGEFIKFEEFKKSFHIEYFDKRSKYTFKFRVLYLFCISKYICIF